MASPCHLPDGNVIMEIYLKVSLLYDTGILAIHFRG